MLEQGNGVVSL